MNYDMKTPCNNCPFRVDVTPFIRAGRVAEIQESLVEGEFPCHKTTEFDDDGEVIHHDGEQHCAGAMILLMKEETPSQMMRICDRLGLFDPSKLDMRASVYDSFDEMLDAHEEQEQMNGR